MAEKWYVATKKADFNGWAERFKISPVLARIMRNRDVESEEQVQFFLHGKLSDCHSPLLMKDMEKAAEIILDAVSKKIKIRIIGDYDVDGICSSYILTKGVRIIGGDVDTAIPHRIYDGYGLNEHLIEEAKKDGVGLIVTCDNGIAAASQIALAKEYGIGVVVTDHHEVPFITQDGERHEILPDALAVVDPKQKKCNYPFPNICGGVVAYKLIQTIFDIVVRKKCENAENIAEAEEYNIGDRNLQESLKVGVEEFLEFAALSTVCDVMELKDENRILVKEGLLRMRNSGNLGLHSLIRVNEIDSKQISAYHLGFVIGPCLNATGRLDTAKRALELLLSTTEQEAMKAAAELKALNDSRKNMTIEGVALADEYIQSQGIEQDKVMIVYLPQVHESLAGIIAGKVREKYNRPTFVLTKSEEGVKGSGRSIEAYNMYESMNQVKDYFVKFGGHKLAAGLSMEEENIEPLREALNRNCTLTEEDFVPQIHIDVPMPMSYANLDLAEQLELLEPFGVGNPKPLFAQKDVIFLSGTRIGTNKNYMRFRVRMDNGQVEQMMYFGSPEKFIAFLEEKFGPGSEEKMLEGRSEFPISVVYQLSVNSYMGRVSAQFILQNFC